MGLKRKASALEEMSISMHQPSSPPSLISTSASPHSSPSSMCTEPYHVPTPFAIDDHPLNMSSHTSPWLNMRTRKRVRDNRPTEEVIHYETLRKLFDAQRHHSDHDPMIVVPEKELDLQVDMDVEMEMEMDTGNSDPSMVGIDDVAAQLSSIPEPNQRSLHDFFRRDIAQSHKSTYPIVTDVEMEHGRTHPRPPPVSGRAVLPCDFAPSYRPQQQWRAEGMLFRSESEV